MRGADLVITAEGRLDSQTAYGKTIGAVAALARQYGLPVLAIAGSLGSDYQELYHLGIAGIAVLPPGPLTLAEAMEQAAPLTRCATERALRLFKAGSQSRKNPLEQPF